MNGKMFSAGIFSALLFSAAAAFGEVELVRDGKASADIVLPENPLSGVKLAAEDLQKHIELMSGAKLPIVAAPGTDMKNHVFVGESEFTKTLGFKPGEFKNSGFEIVAKDNYVILAGVDIQRTPTPYSGPEGLKKWQEFCGEKFAFMSSGDIGIGNLNGTLNIYTNDDLGTWYAVAELLEQLGVRFYSPSENGTVVPEKKTISIADQSFKKESKFARREFCYYGAMRDDSAGISWFKRLKLGNNNVIIFNHTTYDIYSSPEQQKLHPEYLAFDSAGKPYTGHPPGAGMPRYSNPEFRKAAVLYMNKVFDAMPGLTGLTIGPPDGGVKMDARDVPLYGKPTDSIDQKTSNYVWDFHVFLAKELKKSHPDKKLLYMSGVGGNEVPTNIVECPDNLVLPFAQPYSANRVIESTDRAVIAGRQTWFDAMKKAGLKEIAKGPVWDYYLYYRTPEFPRYPVLFTESLQREMKEMLPYSDGKFIEIQPEQHMVEGEKYPRWQLGVPGLMHLMVYWQSKLFWDPDLDRKKMLDEYYDLYFGPARAEMKEFYEFAESVWTRQESRSVTPDTGFLKEKDVERYFEILKRAREKAGSGTVYDKRIAQMEGEMAPLGEFFTGLKRLGPGFEVHRVPAPFTLDGNLAKYPAEWRVPLRDNTTGELPTSNKTEAVLAMTPDNSALIVGVTCYEDSMDKIKADCKLNDTFSIFDDDAVELYFNTPERSYFKIVVNPNGAIWDESTDVSIVDRDTLPILWNPGTKAVVKKGKDCWMLEIMIPTKDFGNNAPTEAHPWGIQVGRSRFAAGCGGVAQSIAPTAGSYATLNRWGNLSLKKEK